MASVNFMKCKGAGTAKAIMRHSEKEERLKHNHSNPDIDKSCTENNSSLYGLSYEEMCAKYDERIRTLDETTNTNKRSDRVTMFSLEYSVPENLPAWAEEVFLSDVEKLIASQYGEQNIIESERHMDEKHKYIDHGEEKESRAHGHTFVIPEIDGKLNGKKFSSKSQMIKLNKAIDEMSIEKYGVYFMTGKDARHQSVEELKHDSYIEQQKIAVQKNIEILQRQYNTSQNLKAEKEQLTEQIVDMKEHLHQEQEMLKAQFEAETARIQAEYAEKEKQIAETEAKLIQREKDLSGRALEAEELKALEKKIFWSAKDKKNVIKTAKLSAKNAAKAEEYKFDIELAVKEQKDLRKENKELKKQIPTIEDHVKYSALENRVQKLEEEIKVRDEFIRDRGMMPEFIAHVKSLGIKLAVMVEEMKQAVSTMKIR